MTITITLNKILAHTPCHGGWGAILARTDLHGGDYDREWPLVAVLDTDRPRDAIWATRCLPEHDRLWRQFAVRCARRVQHLMTDPRSIAALDVAERHAMGQATDDDLAAATDAAWAAWAAEIDAARAARAASAAAWAAASAAAWAAASAAAWAASAAEIDAQITILRAMLMEAR